MNVRKRIKRANDARVQHNHVLLARISKTNDTGLDDGVVLSILRAKKGPWTEYTSVEEMLAFIGAET